MSNETNQESPEKNLPKEDYVLDAPAEQEPTPVKEDKAEEAKEVDDDDLLFNPQNVVPDYPVFIKIEKFDPEALTMPLPSSTPEYVFAKIDNAPNTRLDDSKAGEEWAEAFRKGLSFVPKEKMYMPTLDDPKAEWHQSLESQGFKLMGTSPSLSNVSGQNLTGERAELRFARFAGMGSVFSIPLWHTGIWITIKTPSDGRLLELNREMLSDKIDLGRVSYGLALSSTVSVFTEHLVKVAMEHLYSTNLKTDKNLLDVISSHDIPLIVWGMACAIWNNGFQYERACTHDPEKCNHLEREKLDVTKLLWVNKNALSSWQLAHMARRKTGEVTMEDVERYKKESFKNQKRNITIKSSVTDNEFYFELKIPTIREYFQSSNEWISSIVSGVEIALQNDPDQTERNTLITNNAQATIMRQYSHWVESLSFDEQTLTDSDTINRILNRLSSDDLINEDFTDKIKDYINESVLACIGIPTYKCTVCGGEQKYRAPNKSLYTIIPMDVMQTFFYLLVQKIITIRSR